MVYKLIREGDYLFTEDKSAHLPLNGASIISGKDILPPIEDDVEKLAEEEVKYNKHNKHHTYGMIISSGRSGFVQGYYKAKEKYKYTEEDMRNAYKGGFVDAKDGCSKPYFELYIKYLSQYPTEFEKDEYQMSTLSNGQQVWVGKYK